MEIESRGEVTLPGDSLYHLDASFENTRGETVTFSSLQGQTRLVCMFFTHCEYACPVLVGDLKKIELALSPEEREQTPVTLVSFDTARDSPAVLAAYAEKMGLAPERWQLLHGSADSVRSLAAVLGVRFRPEPGGGFAHSNAIFLLSPEGLVLHTQAGLGTNPEALISTLRKHNPGVRP